MLFARAKTRQSCTALAPSTRVRAAGSPAGVLSGQPLKEDEDDAEG